MNNKRCNSLAQNNSIFHVHSLILSRFLLNSDESVALAGQCCHHPARFRHRNMYLIGKDHLPLGKVVISNFSRVPIKHDIFRVPTSSLSSPFLIQFKYRLTSCRVEDPLLLANATFDCSFIDMLIAIIEPFAHI